MPTDPSPRSPPGEGTPLYAAGDGQAPARRAGALTSTLPVPALRGSDPIPGARTRSPHRGQSQCLPPSLPAKLSSPDCAPGPPAGAPPPGSEQGQARAQGVRGPGAASARGQPPALGGARRAGYKASARWSLRLLLAQSISARRSRAPAGPAPPGAAGHTSPRPPAPGASPGANFAGRGAEVGAGGRPCPAAPRPHRPPAPLTFHGGEQRQQQQRGPQPPQGHGCASRSLGPRRRGARAARAGARAPGSGGRGERRGAAHTQPPPPRSQQNEPSSPGRTGTRAPPALGAAHLSRGRGGSPAGTPPPARARDPSWPRAPPEPQPPASAGPPGGRAGARARTPRASGRRRPLAPPAQQWSLPALWLLQIKQRFQPKCF